MALIDTELAEPTTARKTWEAFATEVGLQSRHGRDIPASRGEGELLIMGTGLGGSDSLSDLSGALDRADVVFHCLADAVTQVMVQRRRPDAIDLSIFYDAAKPRYNTYVQMAEAMLHPARNGKRVLSLYYGHPGIFAMPTHRAMTIARREGIRSLMRPGISALDYLVADVGFDPAYPGLLSYETTDLLLRRRRLDPSVHVVLWQIGVVGQLGYSRKGFHNNSFDLLLDRVEETYGNAEIVHYIGSRFPGIPPIIEPLKVMEFRRPEAKGSITALSTMYIPPTEPGTTDPEIAKAMSIDHVNTAPSGAAVRFDVGRYGNHEKAAIHDMIDFKVPADYRFTISTPGVEFMIDLHHDFELQKAFEADPEAVLAREEYSDLSPRARNLLASRTPKAAHAAMFDKAQHA
jgi:hypothetical protein